MPDIHLHWQPGDQIVQQELWQGQLLLARPVTVAQDNDDALALYSHPKTRYMSAAMRDRRSLLLKDRVDTMLSDARLHPTESISADYHVLTLNPDDKGYAVWIFWDTEWTLRRWYVNLQAPMRRTSLGIQIQDYVLDIVVNPDLSWSWKDEDEFEELVRRGFFTNEQAAAIRDEGRAMIEVIERKGWPFQERWKRWRPDPAWPVPVLPDGWDDVECPSGV